MTSMRARPTSNACPSGSGGGVTTSRKAPAARRRSPYGWTRSTRSSGASDSAAQSSRRLDRGGRLEQVPGDVFLRARVAHREDRSRHELLDRSAPGEMAVLATVGAGDPAHLAAFPGTGRIHGTLEQLKKRGDGVTPR